MDAPPSAPPVVAVVVATDPGECFEDTLRALGSQDYPNLAVLVIAAHEDPTARVAAVLPSAYVHVVGAGEDAGDGVGPPALANDVLGTVRGSSFFVFCHDDVAPEPDAVRVMVEEALRSNAGVVAPKLVDWDRPERLLEVGLAVDKTGSASSVVERGELDQEQHDGVRDVFAVSAACMLVREDLFVALNGFDAAMGEQGAALDLCWRAQVAGARVMVAPAARVRHREADRRRPGPGAASPSTEARDQLRAALKSYSLFHLLRVLPQAAAVSLVEVVLALGRGRWGEARATLSAWSWNLRRLGELRPLRRAVRARRAVPDSEVRRLQRRGILRVAAYLRGQLHAEDQAEALLGGWRRLVASLGGRPARTAVALLALTLVVPFLGARLLLAGHLPGVGELAPFPGADTFLRHYTGGWRTAGMGSPAHAPPAFGLLGLAGFALLGSTALLQKLLVFGAWPLAAAGAWRLSRPLGSVLARLVLVIVYLSVPLPYGALARGRWTALVAYAAAPWLLGQLLRLTGLAPFGHDAGGGAAGEEDDRADEEEERGANQLVRPVLALGLLLALVGALAPAAGLALVLAAIGLLVGSVLVGGARGALRALAGTVLAVAVAAVLLLPWSLDVLVPGRGSTLLGVAPSPASALGLGALLRFELGAIGSPPLGWAVLVAPALPLLMGQGWRLRWAVRLWFVFLTCVLVAWAGGRGWLPVRLGSPDVVLAPAAAALAAAAALGAVAFETDLRRRRFGWRQSVPSLAAAAVVVGLAPLLAGAVHGRWGLPSQGLPESLSWMRTEATTRGSFRVVWLGDPRVLPVHGWSLGEELAYGTSRDGPPDATELWPGPPAGARAIGRGLQAAVDGDITRLGRLLAPMSVRYIVVPDRASPTSGPRRPVPPVWSKALRAQIDLRVLPGGPSVSVFENTAWVPSRALSQDGGDPRPVLPGRGPVRYAGPLPGAGRLTFSEGASPRWSLTVDGRRASRRAGPASTNVFEVRRAGPAVLAFSRPAGRVLAVLLQLGLWAGAVIALRRLSRPAGEEEAR